MYKFVKDRIFPGSPDNDLEHLMVKTPCIHGILPHGAKLYACFALFPTLSKHCTFNSSPLFTRLIVENIAKNPKIQNYNPYN